MVTTAEVHPQPKEVHLYACDEMPQPTSVSPTKDDQPLQPEMEILDVQPTKEEPPNTKRVRWQPILTTIHEIETEGKQSPIQQLYFNTKNMPSRNVRGVPTVVSGTGTN